MRKLTWAAAGFALALLAGHYLLPLSALPFAALGGAVLALGALALRGNTRLRAMLALFAAAAGFAWYWGYTALFVQPAEAFAGESRTVALRVLNYPIRSDGYSRVEVRSIDKTVPHTRMYVYDYSGGLGELRPGDELSAPLKLLSAGTYYKESSDRYLSDGIHLRGYLTGAYTVTGRWDLRFLLFPRDLVKMVKEQALACFPEDAAPLMKAILTGDRTEFSRNDELHSTFKIAGFVHIIAVSGMHVAFLVSMLRLITGRRRITALLGVPMVIVFAAMIGFTPSVSRAAFMMLLMLLAPLLRREEDPPTSLALALLMLLAVNPLAVGNVSLQLSFTAMLGLILITPPVNERLIRTEKGRLRLPLGLRGRILRWICASFSASLGAAVFTTPLISVYYGYMPLYAIITNLLCLWPMSTAFFCGYPICLLGLLWPPAGTAAGWIVGWLPRYVIWMVKQIAGWPMAAVYTRSGLGQWWLIFVYLLFGGAWLLRDKAKPFRPVLPVCAALCTLAAVGFFLRTNLDGEMEVSAVDVGQGESIAALTDTAAVMIDCGSTGGPDNAGDRAAEFLLRSGRDRLDLLILTHFHADHANGVTRLMSRVKVERLVIAADYEKNEYSEKVLAACEKRGTKVYTVAEDSVFRLDDLSLTVYAPLGIGDPNEECLLIHGDREGYGFLVTGDAGGEVERLLTVLHDLSDTELLVVGHHGSRYSTSPALLDAVTPETAFISVGADNGYGHPAPEVIERLRERNIQIYRTDTDGTVSVRSGKEHHGETEGKESVF